LRELSCPTGKGKYRLPENWTFRPLSAGGDVVSFAVALGGFETPIWGKKGWVTELDDFKDYDYDDLLAAVNYHAWPGHISDVLSASGNRRRTVSETRELSKATACHSPLGGSDYSESNQSLAVAYHRSSKDIFFGRRLPAKCAAETEYSSLLAANYVPFPRNPRICRTYFEWNENAVKSRERWWSQTESNRRPLQCH
jgi:hypothetical protein